MLDIRIKLEKDKYEQVLKAYGGEATRNAIINGVKRTTIFLEGEATKRTPVDTGLLRASHRVSFSPDGLNGLIQNSRLYGLFVHQGTKKMKGRPWMENAIKSNFKKIHHEFNHYIKQLFNNIK